MKNKLLKFVVLVLACGFLGMSVPKAEIKYISSRDIKCTVTEEWNKWNTSPNKDNLLEPVKCKEALLAGAASLVRGGNTSLPSNYSLATVGYLADKRCQSYKGCGDTDDLSEDSEMCWAFAAASSIESNYMRENNLHSVYDDNEANDAIKISPAQLSFNATYLYTNGGVNQYGLYGRQANSGGSLLTIMSILAGGRGPVKESTVPFMSTKNNITPATANPKAEYYVNEFIQYAGENALDESTTNHFNADVIQAVKEEIYNHGSVITMVSSYTPTLANYNENYVYLDANVAQELANFYNQPSTPANGSGGYRRIDDIFNKNVGAVSVEEILTTGHAVSIVGWDDSIPKEAFDLTGYTPAGNGAWLIKDSYNGMVDDYYLSYYDYFSTYGLGYVSGISTDIADHTYTYSDLGYSGYLYSEDSTFIFKEQFVSTQPGEQLNKINVGIMDPGDSFNIYYSATDDFNNATKIASGVGTGFGYTTVYLNNPVTLSNDSWFVFLEYTAKTPMSYMGSNIYLFPMSEINEDYKANMSYMPITESYTRPAYYYEPSSQGWLSMSAIPGLESKFYPILTLFTKEMGEIDDNPPLPPSITVTPASNNPTIHTNETNTLTFDAAFENATAQTVNYKILDANGNDVTSQFTVTYENNSYKVTVPSGIAAGTYRFVLSAAGADDAIAQFTIAAATVPTVLVTKITINGAEEIAIAGNANLTVTVEPSNASNKNVTWTSSDNKIATVNENGLITGVAKGQVTITATAKDGSGVKGTKVVKVIDLNELEQQSQDKDPEKDNTVGDTDTPTTVANPKTGTTLIVSTMIIIAGIAYGVSVYAKKVKKFK